MPLSLILTGFRPGGQSGHTIENDFSRYIRSKSFVFKRSHHESEKFQLFYTRDVPHTQGPEFLFLFYVMWIGNVDHQPRVVCLSPIASKSFFFLSPPFFRASCCWSSRTNRSEAPS